MLWDEERDEWKPRYGYKRANDEQAQWCIEVPDGKGTKIRFILLFFKEFKVRQSQKKYALFFLFLALQWVKDG